MNPVVVMCIVFLGFIILGVPIFTSIGLACVSYILLAADVPLMLIPQKIFVTTDSFILLAIPMFMLAGELMNQGGITRGILGFCNKLVGHIRGGLAHVSILACMIFAGMCGSCVAAAAAVGSMMLPELREEGYDDDLSGAVIASAAVLGPVIPPSNIMVIYSSISGDSVARLFLGGIAPGILIGGLLMVMTYFISIKRGYMPKNTHMAPPRELAKAFFASLPALLLPVLVLVGIMSGKFTPSEAGAIAVAYAAILGFVKKELHFSDLPKILLTAAKSSANVLLLMGTGASLGWILTKNQIPQMVAQFLMGITDNPVILILIIIAVVLFLGCFLTDVTIVPLLAPLVLPAIQAVGYDPIAFGVILCTISVCGNLTPPVGGLLFVVSGMGKIPVLDVAKSVMPFLLGIISVLVFCTVFPSVVSFIPNLLMG